MNASAGGVYTRVDRHVTHHRLFVECTAFCMIRQERIRCCCCCGCGCREAGCKDDQAVCMKRGQSIVACGAYQSTPAIVNAGPRGEIP